MPGVLGEVIGLIRGIEVAGALNIYNEAACRAWGEPPGEATRRIRALEDYLASHWRAPNLLVGEAPGKDGARWSGVPFTSRRQLTGSGAEERTAAAMHRALADLDAEEEVLLWNASVLFPPGNRDPRRVELDACAHLLALISRGRSVFAVGRHAQAATGAPYVRHPSHGGGRRFAEGLRIALRSAPGTDVRLALDDLDRSPRPQLPIGAG
jgi:uracil-DNA glycosylase